MANEPEDKTAAPADVDNNPASTPQAEDKGPSWEGEFDEERAKRLVINLREEKKKVADEAAELRKKLNEKEDAEKSEYQRLQERAERAETELSETRSALLVAEISKEYGVPASLLTGKDREEIEAKAKALSEWAGASKRPADDVPGKPRPKLVSGAGVSDSGGEAFDATATAKKIRDRY